MDILKGIRPLDYVLAALMVAAAALIGYENTTATDADVAHALDSDSVLMVPVFALAALPILWRRRHTLAAIAVSVVVLGVQRPGVRLGDPLWLRPSALVRAGVRRRAASSRTASTTSIGLAGIAVLQAVTLVKDASTDGISPIVGALPIALVFYGIGLIVQNRAEKQSEQVTPLPERVPPEQRDAEEQVMGEGIRGALRGTRPLDWVLTGVLTALGVAMMLENINITDAEVLEQIDAGTMAHLQSMHTVWVLPSGWRPPSRCCGGGATCSW